MIVPPFKPRYRSPCNGCGICCALELCVIGTIAFGDIAGPCPALVISDDKTRTFCGFVQIERRAMEVEPTLPPKISQALGIGAGCSMKDSPDDCDDSICCDVQALVPLVKGITELITNPSQSHDPSSASQTGQS